MLSRLSVSRRQHAGVILQIFDCICMAWSVSKWFFVVAVMAFHFHFCGWIDLVFLLSFINLPSPIFEILLYLALYIRRKPTHLITTQIPHVSHLNLPPFQIEWCNSTIPNGRVRKQSASNVFNGRLCHLMLSMRSFLFHY